MRILGIETSCDETAAAVVEVKELGIRNQKLGLQVLSNVVASQIKIHAKTGGVVPEVAARLHIEKIIPVVERALKESKSTITKYSAAAHDSVMGSGREIDAIAVTAGPGLATALLVGVEVARTLSWLWKKPLVAVNHLAGHIYANWLNSRELANKRISELESLKTDSLISNTLIRFPILALIVSGGHTELVLMRGHLKFQIIGETRDDAAGEAFDKVAKMMGFPYPGGPAIAAQAAKFETRNLKLAPNFQFPISNFQINSKFKIQNFKTTFYVLPSTSSINFPRPMINSDDFDFSFSGLKTSVLYYLKNLEKQNHVRPHMILSDRKMQEICFEFQEAVVDVLVAKTIRAAKKHNVKTVLLGGGVAANARLRQRLVEAIEHKCPSSVIRLPAIRYTTDNAAMIAAAGYFMAKQKQFTPTPKNGGRRPLVWGFTPWQKLDVDPNWELGKKFQPIPR